MDEVAEGRGLVECAPGIAFVAAPTILAPALLQDQIAGLFPSAGNALR